MNIHTHTQVVNNNTIDHSDYTVTSQLRSLLVHSIVQQHRYLWVHTIIEQHRSLTISVNPLFHPLCCTAFFSFFSVSLFCFSVSVSGSRSCHLLCSPSSGDPFQEPASQWNSGGNFQDGRWHSLLTAWWVGMETTLTVWQKQRRLHRNRILRGR